MNFLDDFLVVLSQNNTSVSACVSVLPLEVSIKESRTKSVPDVFGAGV